MKNGKVAIIIADTGFSEEALAGATCILGIYDLVNRRVKLGNPYISEQAELRSFASDPHQHGSNVLRATLALAPDVPLVLIRSHDADASIIRTQWNGGKQGADGWTEAYLWAVALCELHGLATVANMSFGRVFHACDGTGWENFQFAKVVGHGKPGNVIVAAAGPGDGRTRHATFTATPDAPVALEVVQDSRTSYNFWTKTSGEEGAEAPGGWVLDVHVGAEHVMRIDGDDLPANLWNGRKQCQFELLSTAAVTFRVWMKPGANHDVGFECWVGGGDARFLNHADATYIVEPAALPTVIAVGLRSGNYSDRQTLPGHKPDVLIEGEGPISFRLPEVVVKIARMLDDNPALDAIQVMALLGKYPAL